MFFIGTDPEFFLVDDKNCGKSAIRFIDGIKGNPAELGDGYSIMYDNVAVEFNTPPVSGDKRFVETLRTALSKVKRYLQKKGCKYKLSAIRALTFSDEELSDEEAKIFGCDPDYSAWTLELQQPPPDAVEKPLRTIGGHIHVGYNGKYKKALQTPKGRIHLVRAMDALIGAAMSYIESDVKESFVRRQLYGNPGSHRPTEYGVEYRVVSPIWLATPELVELTYQLVDTALKLVHRAAFRRFLRDNKQTLFNAIINGGESAHNWLKTLLSNGFISQSLFDRVINSKVKSDVVNDIYSNWRIS